MYVRMYACMHVYVYMYMCIYICIHIPSGCSFEVLWISLFVAATKKPHRVHLAALASHMKAQSLQLTAPGVRTCTSHCGNLGGHRSTHPSTRLNVTVDSSINKLVL